MTRKIISFFTRDELYLRVYGDLDVYRQASAAVACRRTRRGQLCAIFLGVPRGTFSIFVLILGSYDGNNQFGGAFHVAQVNGFFGAVDMIHADSDDGGL